MEMNNSNKIVPIDVEGEIGNIFFWCAYRRFIYAGTVSNNFVFSPHIWKIFPPENKTYFDKGNAAVHFEICILDILIDVNIHKITNSLFLGSDPLINRFY